MVSIAVGTVHSMALTEDGSCSFRASTWGQSNLICLSSRRDDGESDMNFHGKTAIYRIDEADMLVQGSIKRAMEERATC